LAIFLTRKFTAKFEAKLRTLQETAVLYHMTLRNLLKRCNAAKFTLFLGFSSLRKISVSQRHLHSPPRIHSSEIMPHSHFNRRSVWARSFAERITKIEDTLSDDDIFAPLLLDQTENAFINSKFLATIGCISKYSERHHKFSLSFQIITIGRENLGFKHFSSAILESETLS
jgi:hypothetical protein